MKRRYVAVILTFIMSLCLIGVLPITAFADDEGFYDGLDNGRIEFIQDSKYKVKLKLTDGDYTQTRLGYKPSIDLRNFYFEFTINQFNEDGYLRVSFLSSPIDFPLQDWGDGFGLCIFDETAWKYTKMTALHVDTWVYGRESNKSKKVDEKAMRDSPRVFTDRKICLKLWEYDNNNLAYNMWFEGGNTDQVDFTGGTILKSDLPKNFDYTNCYLLISPDIDSRPHSYDNDIVLTINAINGIDHYMEKEHSIKYYVGDRLIRTAYAFDGEKFNKYIPNDDDFLGWFLDKDFTVPFSYDTVSAKDIEVYAKLKEKVNPPKEDPPIEPEIDEENDINNEVEKKESGSGCNSSLSKTGNILMILLLISSVAILFRVKKENKK